MKNVIAAITNAMNVINGFTKPAVIVTARILLHEFLETVFVQLFVFHMKILVLFHIGFIFERKLTSRSVAMKMRGFLSSKRAIMSRAIFTATKPQKSFALYGIILPMIIEVHLYVWRRNVDFVTVSGLDTMIMRLFFVVLTSGKLVRAIVRRCYSPESVFVGFVHFLMPFWMANHFFFFGKNFRFAHRHRAMKMFAVIHVFAVIRTAL